MVLIDLTKADLDLFEQYEGIVLGRLETYGARLTERLRLGNGTREVHLLDFPDADALARFTNDPERLSAGDLWSRSGACSFSFDAVRVDSYRQISENI